MANHDGTSGSPMPGRRRKNGEHMARRQRQNFGVGRLMREPQRLALRLPVTRQLVAAAA